MGRPDIPHRPAAAWPYCASFFDHHRLWVHCWDPRIRFQVWAPGDGIVTYWEVPKGYGLAFLEFCKRVALRVENQGPVE